MKIKTTDLTKLDKELTHVDFEILQNKLLNEVEYKSVNRHIKLIGDKYDILVGLTEYGNISVSEVLCYLLGDKGMTPLQCMIYIDGFTKFLVK